MNAKRRSKRGRCYTLQSLLLMGILVCVCMLLALIAALWLPQMNRQVEANAVLRTRENMLRSVDSVSANLDALAGQLQLACSLVTPEACAGEWREMLDVIVKGNVNLLALAFFDAEGNCLYDTAGGVRLDAQSVRGTKWFAGALAWEGAMPYFSGPYVQSLFEAHRLHVFTMAQAVDYDVDGRTGTGVMMMDVKYAALADMISAMTVMSSGYVYLMDPEGMILAHPKMPLLHAGLAQEDTRAVRKQVVGFTNDVVQGRKRLLFIMTLPQTNWRLVGVAYLDELLGLQKALLDAFIAVLVVAVLTGVAMTVVLAYIVVRPIERLEQQIGAIPGDLQTVFPEEGFQEIRAVYATMNRLLEKTRTLMDQIVKEQEAKRLYELGALQAQINPHFLYNTLDSIIWMEEQHDSEGAIRMTSALARLFRISISRGKERISVAHEIAHVQSYIEIQRMRFGNRFEYEIDMQPGMERELTLKLILQPIVENAINHAADAYREEPLHIRVRAWMERDELRFLIEDDGVGIPAKRLDSLLTTSPGKSGIGLKNVHDRIRLSYGEPYGLRIESEEDVGTRVYIRLPKTGREGEEG